MAHLDEVNPHLHCVPFPVTPDNKLSYRKVFVGEINTHNLTNNSQLEYLSEIVKLAKERNMAIHVIGAADSATGTAAINQRLSEARADYISGQLIALGMSADNIQQQALGGIEEFRPVANNHYCKIQLIPLPTSA